MGSLSDGLLADACALIAFHGAARPPMSDRGVAAMHGGVVAVSAITVWEITRKVGLGKLRALHGQGESGCTGFLRARGYRLLPVTPEIAECANTLPHHHADPMDRILIATAVAEGMTVITSNRIFAAYGVPTLW